MPIDTPSIPSSTLKPGMYAELNTTSGSPGLPPAKKLLLIGQRTATGAQAAGQARQVYTEAEAATAFGPGSVLHKMIVSALRVSRDIQIWAIAQDDAGGAAAATATVTLSGTATDAGSLVLYYGADRVEVAIAKGDTAAAVATRAIAAIGALPTLPVTGSGTAGAVTATVKNKGTVGNQLVVRASSSAPGITLSATKVAFTGGTLTPTLQTALDAVFATHFDVVGYWASVSADLTVLRDHLAAVSSAIELRPGRGFCACSDTVTNAVALATATNHERVHVADLPGSWNPPFEIAASIAARVAYETDPALPFNGLPLPGVLAPDVADRLSRSQQETLLAGGITPLEVDPTGAVAIVRLVTTKTTTAGSTDLSLLDTSAIACLDFFRAAWVARMKLRFGRAKLNDQVMKSILEQTIDVALRCQDLGILQKVQDYKAGFKVERDANYPGRARVSAPAPIVPGLHQVFARFDLITL